jgi:hypothetical protein
MHLVLAAAITKLLQLKTAGDGLLVLRRRVIAFLALRAFQRDNFPHCLFPSSRQVSKIRSFVLLRLFSALSTSRTDP